MSKYNNWNIFDDLINVELDENKKNKLDKYCDLLLSENSKYNLTAIREVEEVYIKHFYDSLLFTNEFKISNENICDIGTGPGFPGLILKIIFPDIKITLVESNGKKINFLKLVVRELELKGVNFIEDRAEIFSSENKETQDIVISRAMAGLNILLEVGVQAIKVGGYFICLKGRNVDEELRELNGQEKLIGLEMKNRQYLESDFLGNRNNLFYEKTKKTPDIYPRLYSQIKKRPLGK